LTKEWKSCQEKQVWHIFSNTWYCSSRRCPGSSGSADFSNC